MAEPRGKWKHGGAAMLGAGWGSASFFSDANSWLRFCSLRSAYQEVYVCLICCRQMAILFVMAGNFLPRTEPICSSQEKRVFSFLSICRY